MGGEQRVRGTPPRQRPATPAPRSGPSSPKLQRAAPTGTREAGENVEAATTAHLGTSYSELLTAIGDYIDEAV
jgi:hypothetical protein